MLTLKTVSISKETISWALPGLMFLTGAAVGALGTKKVFSDKYAAIAEKEIEDAGRYFKMVRKEDEFNILGTPGVDEVAVTVHQEFDTPERLMTAAVSPSVRNIFAEYGNAEADVDHPDFDFAKSATDRDLGRPYVITEEDFAEDDETYEKVSLTYYLADQVLADSNEEAVTEIDINVGIENLSRFGEGSNDPSMLYVRNEQLGLDYEIARADGSYSEIVHGIVIETSRGLIHSDDYRDRRGRKR